MPGAALLRTDKSDYKPNAGSQGKGRSPVGRMHWVPTTGAGTTATQHAEEPQGNSAKLRKPHTKNRAWLHCVKFKARYSSEITQPSLQQTALGQPDVSMPKDECGPYLTPGTKMNSKGIDQRLKRAKLFTLLKENTGINLCDLRLGKGFLNIKPKAQERFFKLVFIKDKNVCASKDTTKKMKWQATEWRKYVLVCKNVQIHTSDKGPAFKTYEKTLTTHSLKDK